MTRDGDSDCKDDEGGRADGHKYQKHYPAPRPYEPLQVSVSVPSLRDEEAVKLLVETRAIQTLTGQTMNAV